MAGPALADGVAMLDLGQVMVLLGSFLTLVFALYLLCDAAILRG
jgi:hypothetical protein